MFNFFRLSATLAAIFSTQVTSTLLATQANAANQVLQPNTSTLIVANETLNARTAVTEFVVDSNLNTPEVAEKVSPSEVAIALAAVGGGAVGAMLIARKVTLNQTVLSLGTEDVISIDQASRKLQQKLLRLLHDDRDTASRLLSQIKIKNLTGQWIGMLRK